MLLYLQVVDFTNSQILNVFTPSHFRSQSPTQLLYNFQILHVLNKNVIPIPLEVNNLLFQNIIQSTSFFWS